MASDAPPSGEEEEVKVRKRRSRRREVERKTVDIEQLTTAGHKALQDGQPEDALRHFKDALKAAGQLQDSRVVQACSFNLGAAYVEAGRPEKGLELLQRVQPGPKADRLPDLQFNLALAHDALGQSQEAAAFFLQAAQLYRSQGDGRSEGNACMEMARCYSRTQDWSLAVQGFLRAAGSYRVAAMLDCAANALKEAGSHMIHSDQFSQDDISGVLAECLSLTDSITEPRTLGELYLWVGVSYCWLRCFQEAVQCFQQALGPAAQQPPLLATVLHNLGAALNSVGQFTPAVDYHRLAAKLYGSLGCRGDQARCFSNLAFACSQLGDEEQAAESFILALQGFRDTEDHPAQVQVCEWLAESYLRQRKQHRAVQLYKQALRSLSHCQDGGGGVQDRLVERLSAALQQSLTVSPQRPHPPRPGPHRPHPHSSPVGQGVRRSDITHSPGTAANQQSGSKQEATAGGGATETPGYMSVVPGHHSSDQQQQPGELRSDREDPPTDSDALLTQEAEAPPTSPGDIREERPPISRWRSRFCLLM